MGICKFCGENKKLINAHIIPKCILEKLGDDDRLICVDGNNKFFEASPKNSSVEKLFCQECDNSFSDLEKYAKEFFYEQVPSITTTKIEECVCYSITNFNYPRLRRFFILMAYRTSVSSINFDLGKYEQIALDLLKKQDAYDENLFVPIIIKKSSPDIASVVQTHINKKTKFTTNKIATLNLLIPHYDIAIMTNLKTAKKEFKDKIKEMFNDKQIIIPIDNNEFMHKKIVEQCKKAHENTLKNIK